MGWRGGGGGGGGWVPTGERNPQRLVGEHLEVGGEAVHPLHIRHLDAVLDGDAGEGVEPADAVEDVAAAGRHGRRREGERVRVLHLDLHHRSPGAAATSTDGEEEDAAAVGVGRGRGGDAHVPDPPYFWRADELPLVSSPLLLLVAWRGEADGGAGRRLVSSRLVASVGGSARGGCRDLRIGQLIISLG